MIGQLSQASVCVVDNEEEEYKALLSALNDLRIGCVHFRGDDPGELPSAPLSSVRLVFQDLHLTADTGKNAASHAANVFCKLVSTDTAPVVVVIWSKYAADPVAEGDVAPEDQKTEAELFCETLEEAEPAFAQRLIYIRMRKLMPSDRPEEWVEQLKRDITSHLEGKESVAALWQWESMVYAAGIGISGDLTRIAHDASGVKGDSLSDGLRIAMQVLTGSQAGGTVSPANAPGQLNSALTQLLVDRLEHASVDELGVHGGWLAKKAPKYVLPVVNPRLNALFLTARAGREDTPFLPGTVYGVRQAGEFKAIFGKDVDGLKLECFSVGVKSPYWDDWATRTRAVLVELSPTCDVVNEKRYTAIFLAGLIVPSELEGRIRKGDAWWSLPTFRLRWSMDDFVGEDVSLVFCSRFQATVGQGSVPTWLAPWFRLRELPTSALRNWRAASVSRIGYVSART